MTSHILLQKQKVCLPPTPRLFSSGREGVDYLLSFPEVTSLHFDLETTGLFPNKDQIILFGFAFTDSQGEEHSIAFPPPRDYPIEKRLAYYLNSRELVAYNAAFDIAFLRMRFASFFKVTPFTSFRCSLTLYRMLATEGYVGQTWSLDTAIEHVLGWESNQKTWLKEVLKQNKLNKGEMYKLYDLPETKEMFATYCALDASASLQLYDYLQAVLDAPKYAIFSGQVRKAYDLWQTLTHLLIEQEIRGTGANKEKIAKVRMKYAQDVAKADRAIRTLPILKPILSAWTTEKAKEVWHRMSYRTEKKYAQSPDDLFSADKAWSFNPQKASSLLKDWEKEAGGRFYYETLLLPKNDPEVAMSFSSTAHLRHILYDHLFPILRTEEDEKGNKKVVVKNAEGKEVSLATTESGLPPVDRKILSTFGKLGEKLKAYTRAQKMLSFAEQIYDRTTDQDAVHAKFKPHGTISGRIAADAKLNLNQLPKEYDLLSVFEAPPGHLIIASDLEAAEKVIQAEFSEDPVLLQLYASGETHDVYLYHMKTIYPNEKVRKDIEKTYRPDGEVLAKLKEKYKKERNEAKGWILAMDYGAGPKKLSEMTALTKNPMSYETCLGIWKGYWETHARLKGWEKELKAERERRGGWILNGLGLPFCVPDQREKDLMNVFAQSTCHGVLMTYIAEIYKMKNDAGLDLTPFIIDFHDETMWLVKEEDAERAMSLFTQALINVNMKLGPKIPFKAPAELHKTLAGVKGVKPSVKQESAKDESHKKEEGKETKEAS